MSIFYNPRTRKARKWIFIAFWIVPVVLILLLWMATRERVRQYRQQQLEESTKDIFKEL